MEIVIRAVFMYLLLLVVLRITTRRVMRTSTPLDMVLIFVFGGIAIQAILGSDHSITGAIVAISSFAGTHLAISFAKLRWPLVGRIAEGSPIILFENGHWRERELRLLRLQQQDVLAEMRQNGQHNMDGADRVVLEHNGGISIIPRQ